MNIVLPAAPARVALVMPAGPSLALVMPATPSPVALRFQTTITPVTPPDFDPADFSGADFSTT